MEDRWGQAHLQSVQDYMISDLHAIFAVDAAVAVEEARDDCWNAIAWVRDHECPVQPRTAAGLWILPPCLQKDNHTRGPFECTFLPKFILRGSLRRRGHGHPRLALSSRPTLDIPHRWRLAEHAVGPPALPPRAAAERHKPFVTALTR
ncbi:hypothetical protein S40288_11476 [Stachybotrys chartarum IBT 40288]|nr:hypothetical protein S40288_11476 [Stachybotrys chartarum IBT 40288]